MLGARREQRAEPASFASVLFRREGVDILDNLLPAVAHVSERGIVLREHEPGVDEAEAGSVLHRGEGERHPARAGSDRASLYDEITNKIIAELEAGRVPWVQPWATAAAKAPLAMPRNAATGRRYSGINVLILWGPWKPIKKDAPL
jgi:N-terminal domain of anti-restriction factor ArdC